MDLSDYIRENNVSVQRLIAQVSQLSSADYGTDMGGGWTVSTALVHLAFWDSCRLALLRRWIMDGVSVTTSDSEVINQGVEALAGAITGPAAGTMAVRAAQAHDTEINRISPELADAIAAADQLTVLRRSVHRNAHLDEIERALRQA